jgi:hypothetical protein
MFRVMPGPAFVAQRDDKCMKKGLGRSGRGMNNKLWDNLRRDPNSVWKICGGRGKKSSLNDVGAWTAGL